ncbi:MAG: substrate-binding domain-containing protein [Kiritimatiellia bacterium]
MRKKVFIALKMAGIAGQEKLTGIFRYLGERDDWDLHLVRTADAFTPTAVRRALAQAFDGFIVSIPGTEPAAAELAASSVPTVVMDIHDARLDARTANLVFVRNDGVDIGRAAARHLLSMGSFRSYAFVHTPVAAEWSGVRFRAFREVLRDHGFWCHELNAPDELAALEKPCGVLTANDDRGFAVLEWCRTRHLAVPRQVAVLGINNDTLICENCHPPLSSVQPDFEQEGFAAARLLDQMMTRAAAIPLPSTLFVGVKQIVRRESTAESSQAGRLVQKAVAFINRHACEGVGVEDVVAHLKCSRRLADLRFRQVQGRSILDALTDRRLDEVKRLLRTTREPIDLIADRCGYANPNYLKNLFKRKFAMTMRAFRQANTPNSPS